MNWQGVTPARTTCFNEQLRVDDAVMSSHCRWLLENGCSGIVPLGSLGEGATLSFDEKATSGSARSERAVETISCGGRKKGQNREGA